MQKIVLDTNVFLISIPKISPYRPIFDKLVRGEFILLITEDIFQEYLEIIAQKTNSEIADNIGELLNQLANVEQIKIFYHWDLIKQDSDDNKFVDCAISGNAKYIVTNDNHFKILKNIDFPKVDIISADDFLSEILD